MTRPPAGPVAKNNPALIYASERGERFGQALSRGLGGVDLIAADRAAGALQRARYPLIFLAPDVQNGAQVLAQHDGAVVAMGKNGLAYLRTADPQHGWDREGRSPMDDVLYKGKKLSMFHESTDAMGAKGQGVTSLLQDEELGVLVGGGGRFWYWAFEAPEDGALDTGAITILKDLVSAAVNLGAR